MPRIKTAQEVADKWARNSIQSNPDRIQGIIKVYFQGRQSLKWVTGLLKNEDMNIVIPILNTFKSVDPEKHETLSQVFR